MRDQSLVDHLNIMFMNGDLHKFKLIIFTTVSYKYDIDHRSKLRHLCSALCRFTPGILFT